MKKVALIALVSLAAISFAQFYGPSQIQDPGSGQRALKAPPSAIGVDQKLNDSIPLGLEFTDSDGKKVTLREYFTDKPVVLMPVFYACAGVCTMELNNMTEALRGFKKDNVGEDLVVVTFTIKPTETHEMAKAKKDLILDIYNRKGAEKGWHFLTGEMDQIQALTNAIGFRYEYDPSDDTVVHPAAAVVLTPQGQISKYFLETEYQPRQLLDAVQEAGKGRIGGKVEATEFWNCIQIDPITGQRTLNIIKLVNLAGLVTLIALTVSVIYMSRKYKTKSEGGTGA